MIRVSGSGAYGTESTGNPGTVRQVSGKHLTDAGFEADVLLPQEQLHARKPIVIHRHLGVKAEHLAARPNEGRGVGQLGEVGSNTGRTASQ